MRRPHWFLVLTGVVGLAANALAILRHFSGGLGGWQPDIGLLLSSSLVTLGYLLSLAAGAIWRWTERRATRGEPSDRTPAFLLNALTAFPALVFWSYLLLTALAAAAPGAERWLLALGLAWVATPFAALGLIWVGEVLGPLLREL